MPVPTVLNIEAQPALRRGSGVLSPLLVGTPTTSRSLQTLPSIKLDPPSVPGSRKLLALAHENGQAQDKGKGKEKEEGKGKEKESKEIAARREALARAFLAKSWLVKESFERWVQKAMDLAEWKQACRKSEAYKEKIQRERLSKSFGSEVSSSVTSATDKRARSTMELEDLDGPKRKRARRRASVPTRSPRTDEELAQRLREVNGW
jgi:nuclear mRNA export protein SAC3